VLLIQSNAVSVIVATDIDRGHDDLHARGTGHRRHRVRSMIFGL
jgi:hypothetical protein